MNRQFLFNRASIILIFFCLFSSLSTSIFSQDIFPVQKIKTAGAITDFVIHDSEVIVSTDAGTIETYSINDHHQSGLIQMPLMADFMGDLRPAKVYTIDYHIENKLLAVTQGKHGFRNITMGNASHFDTIIDADQDKMMVKKARFIDKNTILFATLSNELTLYHITDKKPIYTLYISAYAFSDFCLSDDKQFAFTTDESGIVHKVDIRKGEVVKEYSGGNVDNVYALDYKNEVIITAGQDRRVGVYFTTLDQYYYLQEDFLVYCAGMRNDGDIGAFSASEESDITLFNVETQQKFKTLKGHKSTVTKIEFLNNNKIISSADDSYLMIWEY